MRLVISKIKSLLVFVLAIVIFVLLLLVLCIQNVDNSKAYDDGIEGVTVNENLSTDVVVSSTKTIQEKLEDCNDSTTLAVDEEVVSADLTKPHGEVTVTSTDIICDISQDTEVITACVGQDNISDISTVSTMTTEHEHSYVKTSSCMYHPEEGHYEEMCVEEGYSEDIYEYYDKYCYYCGVIMDDWGFEELLDHSSIHGAYGTYKQLVDSIWHEPVYEQVWVVDVEGYYEEEVVVECIECGYIERSKYYGD